MQAQFQLLCFLVMIPMLFSAPDALFSALCGSVAPLGVRAGRQPLVGERLAG